MGTNEFAELEANTMFSYYNEDILFGANNADTFDYSNKSVLVIGSGCPRKASLVRTLKRLPLKNLVCLGREATWALDSFTGWIYAEQEHLDKKEDSLQAVRDYMSETRVVFDAVFTYLDTCTQMTSYLASCLNLRGIPFEFIHQCKNKANFRQLCSQLDIKTPKFFLIKSAERRDYLNQIINDTDTHRNQVNSLNNNDAFLTFPVIIKNPMGVLKGEYI